MKKIRSLPLELFVEVLDYLADYEYFPGLDQILDKEYTALDVRSALREMSLQLRDQMEEAKKARSLPNYQKDGRFSSKSRQVLSVLSPGDERKLLDRFGLLDES